MPNIQRSPNPAPHRVTRSTVRSAKDVEQAESSDTSSYEDTEQTIMESRHDEVATLLQELQNLRTQLEAITTSAAKEKQERQRLEILLKEQQSVLAPSVSTAAAVIDTSNINSATTYATFPCTSASHSATCSTITTTSSTAAATVTSSATPTATMSTLYGFPMEPRMTSQPIAISSSSRYTWPPAAASPIYSQSLSNISSRNLVPTFLPPLNNVSTFDQQPYRAQPILPQVIPQQPSLSSIGHEGHRKLHDLPEFHGRPEEWPMFCMAFLESSRMFGYSQVENMFRLQRSIKGGARDVVESLLIHPDNVDQVMSTLEFHFGRPECLVQSQLRKVRETASIPENKLELIIPFATKVQNLTTFLEASGMHQHLANPAFLDELVGKLPMSRRLDWAQTCVSIRPYATVKDFNDWLSRIARLVCIVSTTSLASSPPNKTDHKPKPRSILHANESLAPANVMLNECRYCKAEQHPVLECNSFKTLDLPAKWTFVRHNRLCFSCLKRGHSVRSCRMRKQCGVDNCSRMHHQSLHEADVTQQSTSTDVTNQGTEAQSPILNCNDDKAVKVLFRILPVRVHNGDTILRTHALYDEGSSVTIMSEDLAKRLRLEGTPKDLNLRWLGCETLAKKSSSVDLIISADQNDAEKYHMRDVQTVADLCLPTQTFATTEMKSLGDSGIRLDDYSDAKPEILIGLDNSHLGAPLDTYNADGDGPIVTRTKLGWVVYGRTGSASEEAVVLFSHQTIEEDRRIDTIVEDYFRIENFGVGKPKQKLISETDKRALQILTATTARKGDRYSTGLLWKEDNPVLPRSYQLAKKRFLSLETKMHKDPEFADTYKKTIADYVGKGYARKLNCVEALKDDSKTWYLPHFGVKNPNKPGKTRLVFDAAAEVSGVSLNSFLLKGPDDYRPLLAVLFNFRLGAIAVIGDIKEMFHQILIRPEDQQSQRFLWRNSVDEPIEKYVMEAMTFGAACSPCIANFVKNHNASRFSLGEPRAVEAIINNHYVDDFVDSFDSVAEAINVTQAVVDIHRRGGFTLRNLMSNSEEVNTAIRDCKEENYPGRTIDMNIEGSPTTGKVLGMCWDSTYDVFVFQLKFPRISRAIMEDDRRPTKREFLSITMSIFDPFGMIANFTLYLKLLLRSIWAFGIAWDDPIPDESFEKWKQWKMELPKLNQLKVPRCHNEYLSSTSQIDLHTFVDASEEAFSAVTYIRMEHNGQVSISLVCGKTRGSPKKLISIPRLELSAAILGVRLCTSIVDCHKLSFTNQVFWSDSKTVLHWLRSDPRRHKEFVGFRIAEILESCRVNQWRWVPSKQNPADDGTRVKYPPQFQADNKWVKGPSFLKFPEADWPKLPDDLSTGECKDELRPKYVLHGNTTRSYLFDATRFSKYSRLQRTIAWLLRFINICKGTGYERGELTVPELRESEILICRQVQRETFASEIDALRRESCIVKDSPIYKLSPYLDDRGLMRISGRIDAATTIPLETRRPVILPKNHRVTTLVIDHFHRRCGHQNDDTVVNEIRQRFWVSGLRTAVKRVRSQCQLCRIRTAKPTAPLMGQLPVDRLTPNVRPFTYSGLDYFGPVTVTVRRRVEKRWVALFTCLTVRAIHLEIATDLSSDACILCIRNFVNRRGVPIRITSDNGTNFVGANKELLKNNVFDNEAVKAELSLKGIEWRFNCPANPHAGGCWERLVQSVKRVLSRTLSEISPRMDTLQSALIEAENIVNSRPLTHLPVTTEDEEPLTPNHFIMGGPNSMQTPGRTDGKTLCLKKQWRVSQQLKDRFWKRWIAEYLPMLTRRCKWFEKVKPLRVGDLVLVCDVNVAQNKWLRGKITNVYPGIDGQVRLADVQTTSGTLRRPAVKLAVLDLSEVPDRDSVASRGVGC